MKSLIYILITALLLGACSSEPHYVVKGKIEGADSVTFYLQKRDASRLVNIDSALAVRGSFKMKGFIEFPEMVMLFAKDTRMRTTFYLENSEITITGTLDSLFNATVTGSKTQDEYNSFIESNKPLTEKYTSIYNEYQIAAQKKDFEKVAELEKQAEAVQKEMNTLQKDFIKSNTASYFSPFLLQSLSYEMDAVEIESYITEMDTSMLRLPVIKDLTNRITVMKAVSVGKKAPDFTMNDVEGNPVTLSSKIGPKFLLIDFWAAWCSPCRQENPNVVKIYKEFNKKGFDVLGVSLDRTREEWVKAIADDKLTWTHVSDLQYWNNAAAKVYAVNAIPANFVLDENGIIIARNLRGEDLYNKVKEVLSSK